MCVTVCSSDTTASCVDISLSQQVMKYISKL